MVPQDPNPLITTIIPTFRRPRLLRRAIRSVLAQTYPHFQVCVHDNASGDETASVVAELAKADPRVQYHCQPENVGAFRNFVYGAQCVETAFFSFLSDDDLLLPSFFQTAIEGFEKHPEAVFSATATIYMDEGGTILEAPVLQWEPGLYRPPAGLQAILKHGHPAWTGIVFRREVWDDVGGLDEAVGPPGDLDFEMRIAAHFPIVVSTLPGAIFVIHPSSVSGSRQFDLTWPSWSRLIVNITRDEGIPIEIRLYAKEVLTRNVKRRLFVFHGLGSIAIRRPEEARRAAQVLRAHFRCHGRAVLLHAMAKLSETLPATLSVLAYLKRLRWRIFRIMNRGAQHNFGQIARHLEL